jgi:hypothetical protein
VRKKGARGKNDIVVNEFFKYKIVENGFFPIITECPSGQISQGRACAREQG